MRESMLRGQLGEPVPHICDESALQHSIFAGDLAIFVDRGCLMLSLLFWNSNFRSSITYYML